MERLTLNYFLQKTHPKGFLEKRENDNIFSSLSSFLNILLLLSISFPILVRAGTTSAAPFRISTAPPPLYAKGESLKILGFNNIEELLANIKNGRTPRSVTFSPNGLFIATGYGNGTISVREIQNQTVIYTFNSRTIKISSIAFSPNSRFIAIGGLFNIIELWDIQNKKLAHTFEGHSSSVTSVAFSSDGRFMASGSRDKTIKLWNIYSKKLSQTFDNSDSVTSVVFSPDGRFIASGSDDTTVKLWDIHNKKLARTFEVPFSIYHLHRFQPCWPFHCF